MTLDVNTLFHLTMYVEAILGLLLLLVWVQNMGTRAVAWWGAAHLLRSLSVALYGMYGGVPDLISIDLAGAILFTSYGVTWTGARVFEGRDPLPGSLILGAILWLLASQFPDFAEATNLRAVLSGGIIAGFSWLAAHEFWHGRDEALVSRWPAIVLLFVHGALFLLRSPLSKLVPDAPSHDALSSAWLTVISAEALLFTISIAFVLVAMAKERSELRQRTAACIDPLTGLANRRGFLQDAEELVQLQIRRSRPVAVFLLDLDHFKSVNDRFGHAVGDRVLRLFADVAARSLRSSDLIGRLGGEEFAVLLADADRDNAYLVAERVRAAFEAAAQELERQPLGATVSIGIAIIQSPQENLTKLLTHADQALYRAKARGRNRVELASLELLAEDAPTPAQYLARAVA